MDLFDVVKMKAYCDHLYSVLDLNALEETTVVVFVVGIVILERFVTEYDSEDLLVAVIVVANSAVVEHVTNAKPREVVRLLIDSA